MTGDSSNSPNDSPKEPASCTATNSSRPVNCLIYRYGSILIAFLLIAATLYCRIRLLDVPLERDEGGFAYIGQQLLQGVSPYHSGNMKVLPGIYFAYAGIMLLFGENSIGIHVGLLVVNLISIVLMYLLSRRFLSLENSVIAMGTYAILSVSQSVLGVFAHATHFVVLFVLAGLVALLHGLERNSIKHIFLCGLCLGTAILMKQHGLFFCLFAVCYLAGERLTQQTSLRTILHHLAILIIGIIIPYVFTCVYMYANGVFHEFWFWTVTRSLKYAVDDLSAESLSNLQFYFSQLSLNVICFWMVSLAGLTSLFTHSIKVHRHWFIISLFLFSALAVLPGFSFYPHYFVVMLPCLSLLTGVAVESLKKLLIQTIGMKNAYNGLILLFLTATIFSLYSRSDYLFKLSPYYVSRIIYGLNPFPESREIAEYIKEHTPPGSPIAVFGSEPQIYFYADRPSATDYLFMYSLVKQQQYVATMQQEFIDEIEASAPEYVVFVRVPTSWMFEGDNGSRLLEWIDSYLTQFYQQVGVVDLADYGSNFYWDSEATNRQPSSEFYILVFKKVAVS